MTVLHILGVIAPLGFLLGLVMLVRDIRAARSRRPVRVLYGTERSEGNATE